MKSFAAALCVLVLLIGAVAANELQVDGALEELIRCAERSPEGLREAWEGTSSLLSLTVPGEEMEQVENVIFEYDFYMGHGQEPEAESARERAVMLLRRMREHQRLSLGSVL